MRGRSRPSRGDLPLARGTAVACPAPAPVRTNRKRGSAPYLLPFLEGDNPYVRSILKVSIPDLDDSSFAPLFCTTPSAASHAPYPRSPVATRRPRCPLFPEWPQWSACCLLDLSHSCPVSTPHVHYSSPCRQFPKTDRLRAARSSSVSIASRTSAAPVERRLVTQSDGTDQSDGTSLIVALMQ